MRYFRIFGNILSHILYILLILRMLTFYEMPFSPWFCQGSGAVCLTLWGGGAAGGLLMCVYRIMGVGGSRFFIFTGLYYYIIRYGLNKTFLYLCIR